MRTLFYFLILFISSQTVLSQTTIDSNKLKKEYTSLEEALKNPEKVYNLNLSNQNVSVPKEAWAKFTHLETLSFKNDHLKEIPFEIGLLKNLKMLDLSGTPILGHRSSLESLEEN